MNQAMRFKKQLRGGYEAQADDGIVVDSSNKTVTYNKDIDVTIKDLNDTGINGSASAIHGNVDGATSGRNWKYVYNGNVNIIFDNCKLYDAEIVDGDVHSGWNTWTFNGAVNVTIKDCNFKNFAATNYSGVTAAFGDEQYKSFIMNKKLTVNIENSTIGKFNGGLFKPRSYWRPQLPLKGIDAILNEGIDINLSKKSNITTLIGGHYFGAITAEDKADEPGKNQNFSVKGVNITADDSTIGGICSGYTFVNNPTRKDDVKIDGDFNITLKNGATLTTLISNGAVFGGNKNISGNVTGKTTFTTSTNMSMTQMRNVDVLNLGAPLAVKPASATTGANLTLPTNGMEVNFVNADTWKNQDVAFTYQYTDGTYPAVDVNLMKFNWTKDTVELKYNKDDATSTQQWQFLKTKVKVEYVTNNNETLAPDLVPAGTKVTKPTITKKGHQFEGWYTTNDFRDGTEFDFNQTIDGDTTLYAKWSAIDMTVKLEPNDGSKINDVKVPFGSTMSEPTLKTREGYTLDGWYTTKDFQENTKFDFNTSIEDDMTLYAKWNQNEYTVKVETNGGSAVGDMKVLYGKTIKEPTSNKEGYTLEGWYTDKDFKTQWNFNDAVKSNMTLYAKWIENKTPVKPENPAKPENPVKPSDDNKKPSNNDKNPSDEPNKGNKEDVKNPSVSANTSSTNQNKTKKKSPKTGDTTPIVSSFAMMGAGLLSMIGILRKKEHK